MSERAVESTWQSALVALRRPEEPSDGTETTDRLAEALERRADAIGADDLRHRFGEVLDADTRRTARHRRWWLLAVGALVVVALGVAVAVGVQRYSGPAPAPTPSPAPPHGDREPDRALVTRPRARRTHPGVDPLVRGRPWLGRRRDGDAADRGHDDAAAGEPGRDPLRPGQRARQHRHPGRQRGPTARHGRGRVGRPGVGPRRPGPLGMVPTPYGWKSLLYAGPDPSYGYLVLWTDSSSIGPPRAVDVGRHPAHRVRHGALQHVRWAAPPGRPGQRRRVDRPALVARRPPAAAGPRHRHGGRSWAVHPTPVVRATGPLVADRGGRRLWLVGAGQHLRRPRRSAPPRDARGGDAHPRGGGLGGHRLPRGADGQPLLRVPGDARDRRSRHADHVCRRPRPAWSPTSPSGAPSTSAAHVRGRRRPARRLRPRLRPGHRAGRTRRGRPDGPSGLRSHRHPRRPGSPRSIGAKRGVLATHRGEAEIVVGRTSWGG